ncbi:HTH domain protein [Natrialba magadii ATCC 43099]|uniref:HTH domain protein n=1 Tax=Natrialba magadii (strain ATCC 43099 / DSM 3394 / CCM 3739 / CIP 104546 / IAM 13178 / JCM 8861 / NBRC 102185 / NCIMB 2190 / MS3) TaxID=547559 RepID=D3SRF8_NATMM|nr:hypothetical protein [Natrialba magadii]ADD04663.1 HTH domain protein [Natrialba magadii ATCC 43099]ELY25319.1 hypothetical protein C500_17916 [Natrialba magadii ATCC 43099]
MDYGTGPTGDEGDSLSALFASLAREPRRHLLGVLYEHASDSLSLSACATRVVSRTTDTPRENVSETAIQQLRVSLHHVHLPKLADAGLIDRDTATQTVTLADHSAYRDSAIVNTIRSADRARADSLDAVFDALADSRRRSILACLNHSFQEIHLETLARDVATREQATTDTTAPESGLVTDQLLASLEHTHLPTLAAADLIDFDTDARTVSYSGHPALCVSWLHSVLNPDLRMHLTEPSPDDGVRSIDGREAIVAYSQSLLERADEELFSVFTSPRLLESGCFARAMDAARRGVDVYLGTTDPVVRELVRANAPTISLWEPTDEWLSLSVQGETVGRLVLADRESLLFGSLGERLENHRYAETALIGDGEAAHQLLGAHFDRIDQKVQELESAS